MDEIRILSLGGGVDSSALLAMHFCREEAAEILEMTRDELDQKLPDFQHVVFADPGSEWPATYENIKYAEMLCNKAGLPFKVVTYKQGFYRHTETNERITVEEWRALRKDEKENWNHSRERQTIFEWLTDRPDGTGSLPMLPGSAHQCSERYKGGIQRKWADKHFGKDVTKTWSLGIEANESKRHKRFTMNRDEKKNPQHRFIYPLVELNLKREDCQEILRQLNWDFRGDGSEVEKSSCMWCPWVQEWEVDRLIDEDGVGLQEALEIERVFYESYDKHERWHDEGMPRTNGAVKLRKDNSVKITVEEWNQMSWNEQKLWKPPRAPNGMHSKPFQTDVCDHPHCADRTMHGKATLVQLKYEGKRLTIMEHIERLQRERAADPNIVSTHTVGQEPIHLPAPAEDD